ncbi:DCN1-like protein 5 [Smittium culicis]|uniref:Defective in cullin neddylation protein n=1 Tax=Smittium culicis TaxID=133412 RepID=A0A1R1Y5J9_9FUNG|nr:DCN1-like protein 5 [Smittium culicis]
MPSKILFNNYKENGQDYISPEGFETLVDDLNYSMDQIEPIVLSWLFGCTKMGNAEWNNAFKTLNSNSKDSVNTAVETAKASLSSQPALFKQFYLWTFLFAKDPNSKSIPSDIAASLFSVIFGKNHNHIQNFINYICLPDTVQALNKDQWASLYDFSLQIAPDFSNYDFEASWPVIFDEFVAYSTN